MNMGNLKKGTGKLPLSKWDNRADAVKRAKELQAGSDVSHPGYAKYTVKKLDTGRFQIIKNVVKKPALVKNGILDIMFGKEPPGKDDLVFTSPNMNTQNMYMYDVDHEGKVKSKSEKMDMSEAKKLYEKAQYNTKKYGHVLWAFNDHDLGKKLDASYKACVVSNPDKKSGGYCVINKSGEFKCYNSLSEGVKNKSHGSIMLRNDDFKKISNLAGKLLYDKACEVAGYSVKKNPVNDTRSKIIMYNIASRKEALAAIAKLNKEVAADRKSGSLSTGKNVVFSVKNGINGFDIVMKTSIVVKNPEELTRTNRGEWVKTKEGWDFNSPVGNGKVFSKTDVGYSYIAGFMKRKAHALTLAKAKRHVEDYVNTH